MAIPIRRRSLIGPKMKAIEGVEHVLFSESFKMKIEGLA